MMTLRIFREGGVPAARSFHTRVYLNGEYMGHYLNVEQIDDEFALTRFGNDTGNLYKCHWGSTLEDNGQIQFAANTSDDKHRFDLRFKNTESFDTKIASAISIFSFENRVHVKNPYNYTIDIFIYDIMGREVQASLTNQNANIEIPLSVKTGNYIVKVIGDSGTETKKVFIK